jgi:predicted nucleotidyltransferase
MVLPALLIEKREQILRLAAQHGAVDVRVFGSFARGEPRPDSDVDFLVRAQARTAPWFPSGLVLDLQQLLGRKVDIVTERGLQPSLRDRVLAEAVPL